MDNLQDIYSDLENEILHATEDETREYREVIAQCHRALREIEIALEMLDELADEYIGNDMPLEYEGGDWNEY